VKRRIATGRRLRLAVGLALVAAVLAGLAVRASLTSDPRIEATVAALEPAAIRDGRNPVPRARTSRRQLTPVYKQMPNPVRVSIPAIGVDAPVIRLGLNPDRTIEVPKDFADAGWFEPGPEPGEQGPAVVVGHLESLGGPGVFYRLRNLRVGQVITIHIKGGSIVRYVADSMIRVPKGRFPTRRVYGRTKQPTLRLITCAGEMNSTGYHPDNYIVFASLVS
jgi:sortase (surface protein transpeptidase)